MVLYFDKSVGQTSVCFKFCFEAEVIVDNPDNIVEKIYQLRKYTPKGALHIHFFGGILVCHPRTKGFSDQWKIQAGNTAVKRICMFTLAEKTA
ncbi:MAG: hypothetical protein ACK55K_00390 [Bacteroidota bacterium]|jgi:hypothetical protein